MAYSSKEPDVVEKRTVVTSDTGSSAGWAVVIVLAVLVVLGLIGYYAFAAPNQTTVQVQPPSDSGRAQNITVNPPSVNVNPPPVINNNVTPPSTTGSTGGNTTPSTPPSNSTTGQ